MKRILATLFALAMLLCMVTGAAAESSSPYGRVTVMSGQVMPYVSSTGIFGMDVPSDYTILNLELAESLTAGLETMTEDEFFAAYGIDTYTASSLLSIATPEILATYDIILAPDFIANINTAVTPNMGITSDMIYEYGPMLGDEIISTYINSGVPAEDCMNYGLCMYGNTTYLCTYVLLNGSNIYQFVTFTDNGEMIMLTFTEMALETIEPIVESLVIY